MTIIIIDSRIIVTRNSGDNNYDDHDDDVVCLGLYR